MKPMTRRSFLTNTLAASATVTIAGTKSSGRVLGANDVIRVGVAGIHGSEDCPMTTKTPSTILGVCLLSLGLLFPAIAEERTEHFDRDPGWEGHNNRLPVSPRTIRQDFGYSKTSHAAEPAGRIGGFITAAAEPAYYAKKLPVKGKAPTSVILLWMGGGPSQIDTFDPKPKHPNGALFPATYA